MNFLHSKCFGGWLVFGDWLAYLAAIMP